ncbi:D-alanyl-D-alanine dipeptidase [Pedobacter cryoconitis]|uniref:D-alanyl-D-alanine dipeptidase n=1 Tax=Pedobacter cryoconitis TaxID=188932 RepID=A0A127VBP7_9SPHI|nr:M15 family metallopeptidase [Pedobacter cryoconitis]AMP98776.1 D-alanyl-D-alanine dipeptidase [Pedobacter cryoconitis]
MILNYPPYPINSMLKTTAILLFVLLAHPLSAQPKNSLKVINSLKVYQNTYARDPNQELIELKKIIPDLVLDIRYATANNFMKQVMYPQARAFARKPVAEQLKKIQAHLRKKGYGLKIYDAYRPYAITVSFYKRASDKRFVANPAKGSKHNRGCAVDLTLIDFKTKKEVPMPTPYDSFAPEAAAAYQKLPAAIIRNRDFLIRTMRTYGFRVIKNEWWHYDFIGWQNYALMDIPFKSL